MALTRQQIVDEAIAMLDEGGLAALSLRRLAERLGVGVATLYWHVKDKRQLLDLVSDAFIANIYALAPDPGEDVFAWVDRWCRELFVALRTHPDGALIMAGNRPTSDSFGQMEVLLERFGEAGFAPAEAVKVLLAFGNYVIGVAVDLAEEEARPDEDHGEAPDDFAGYPLLRQAGYPTAEERFDAGLRMLLAGARTMAADTASSAG